MKQWTDKDICRHYRFKDQYSKLTVFEGSENHKDDFVEISEDPFGEGLWITIKDSSFSSNEEVKQEHLKFPSVELSKKQAAKLARLFEHFAANGTLPVPKRQDVVEEEID